LRRPGGWSVDTRRRVARWLGAVGAWALCAAAARGGAGLAAAEAAAPWWYTLERGKLAYRTGAYGDALLAFEDARRERAARFERLRQDFVILLSRSDVRRLGDDLELIERYIRESREDEAALALNELFYRVPENRLKNSAARALDEFDRLKAYPEAEFWLGETYRAEGELGLALAQYQKAYGLRDCLETPAFVEEILYKLSEVHRLRGEYQEMENRLLELLALSAATAGAGEGDSQSALFTRAAMIRTLENEGVEKFLTLYRSGNGPAERAYRRLGFYYYASSRHAPAAERLMFAFLIQSTTVIAEVTRSRYGFAFTTLDALMDALARRGDLTEYLDEVEYFRTAYYLANALYATGKSLPARQLWGFLAGRPEAGEWQGRAQAQLRGPSLDRAVELP